MFIGTARQAYTVAQQNPGLLAQLWCYCGCDRTSGHRSLLDCYRDYHGANCAICSGEALEANQLFNQGSPVDPIRHAFARASPIATDIQGAILRQNAAPVGYSMTVIDVEKAGCLLDNRDLSVVAWPGFAAWLKSGRDCIQANADSGSLLLNVRALPSGGSKVLR